MMNRNRSIAIIVTAAILALGWWILSGGAASVIGDASFNRSAGLGNKANSSATQNASAPALAPQNVLSIRPNAPKPSAAIETAIKGAAAAAPYKESELARAYRMRESAQALLARIAQTPDDGEALRIKAKILENCATIKDDEWREAYKESKLFAQHEKEARADPRAAFLKTLPKDQSDGSLRVAAFDRLNINFCDGLKGTEVTKSEINALFSASAKLGDVPSIAREFACDIASAMPKTLPNMSMADQIRQEPAKIELTQARRAQLQEILRMGHPDSMPYLSWAMNVNYSNLRIKLPGQNDNQRFNDFKIDKALQELISCDLGAPCSGANNPALDRRCAFEGQCNLESVADAIHYYELSPASAQSVEITRGALRNAIVTGNFTELKFVPVDANETSQMFFFGRNAGSQIGCRG
jgi:hypothetical protein